MRQRLDCTIIGDAMNKSLMSVKHLLHLLSNITP